MRADMKLITSALRDFLARHNISNERSVGLVLVTHDRRTAAQIEAAIKLDTEPSDMAMSFGTSRSPFPRADMVLNDVPIAVRVPKETIEV